MQAIAKREDQQIVITNEQIDLIRKTIAQNATPAELWLPVIDYVGIYEISSFGRVRRIARAKGATVGGTLKPGINGAGYLYVVLSKKSRTRNIQIHKLVAGAFLGERPVNHEINHKDGLKHNNYASNLEYVTRSENTRHAYHTGLIKKPFGKERPCQQR